MRLEHYSIEKLKQKINTIVGKYLDLTRYKLFFFGSRVIGRGTERSDIDIGIIGPDSVKGKILADIEEEIEQLPILYKIEIVDFSHVDTKFKKVALLKSEPIT